MASNALAHLHRFDGRLDAAEPLYDEALGLSRKLGDHEMEAVGLLNLAMVAIGRSADAQAVDLLRQVLAIAAETQSRQAMQSFFEVAAAFAASMKDWERAARLFGTAERHMNETGIRRDPADEAFLSPWLARAGDALGREQFARQLAAGGSVPFDKARDEAGDWLAELAGLRTR